MHRISRWWAGSGALALLGCVEGGPPGVVSEAPVLADEVVEAPGATGEGFGDPTRAVNGVRGAGPSQGSFDVYSLDYDARPYLVLGFRGRVVTDGPGDDFAVFENGFRYASGRGYFMDPVIVSVSRDGQTWVDMPHAYVAADPTRYSHAPEDWEGFAGLTPVLLHAEDNPVDPFDRVAAGGDAFDLASLPLDGGEAEAIRREGFRYVRLESAAIRVNPETGQRYPRDPTSNGADIDGVIGRWLAEAP